MTTMQGVSSLMGLGNLAPEQQFLANLVKFGDVRCFTPEKIYEYYSLNDRQVKTVEWVQSNLLPYYSKRKNVDINLLKGSVTFHRIGLVPGHEWLIVSTLLCRIDAPTMLPVEVRNIQIGTQGGRRLLNPYYKRNWVEGEAVLKVEVMS